MNIDSLPYDKTSAADIERYAKELIGKTFFNVLENNFKGDELSEKVSHYNNPRSKGGLGNLLEEFYFYYRPNSDSGPDFSESGTELKVTPYEITKSKKIRAGERLVIGMISNEKSIEQDFFKSHLINKMGIILLVLYLREKGNPRTSFKIDYVQLFSILSEECKEDLEIIKNDYKIIANKIVSGKAHELSEGDTKYLGACTKGSTAEKSLKPQYCNPDVLAKRRAFSLKQGYMTYVINHYILGNLVTYDSVFTAEELKDKDFDTEIVNKIKKYKGESEQKIYEKLKLNRKSKKVNNLAICRMLGVKSDRVAEFEKADIKIKTIRVQKNGKPKESISFPAMIIKDFVEEEFENSIIYDYFSSTRFLFVVFRENENGEYILSGSKFWNMPITELESTGCEEWTAYRDKFRSGVNFKKKIQKNGIVIRNDLPKKKNTKIFHLRPHANKSAYDIKSLNYSSGEEKDKDELPNGDRMTKQCFWLNNSYIADVIRDI